MTLDVLLILLILFGVYLLLLRRFVLPHLPAFGKWLLVLLSAAHLALIALSYASRGWGDFWVWYLDFRFSENNPSASFAAMHYFLITLGSGLIALFGGGLRWRLRLYWLGVGLFFGYLGLDEYTALHEGAKNWQLYYGAAAGMMALAGFVLLRRDHRDMFVWFMLVGGVGVAAVGGVGLEMLALYDCLGYLGATCKRLPVIEEVLENIGILTALLGTILYAQRYIQPPAWAITRRLMTAGGIGITALLIAGPWFVPALEARYLAEPLTLEYLDGSLTVLGYRVSHSVLNPGDRLDVQVYWRTSKRVSRFGGISSHLVNPVTGQSFAHVNRIVHEPHFNEAAPRTVYRTNMQLVVPSDIPAQTSYWLTLTIWRQHGQGFAMQPISYSAHELVTPDMAVLRSLPVVDDSAPLLVDHPVRYDFQGDLALSGYSAQLDQKRLNLQFLWENRATLPQPLIQFVHIFDADGNFAYSMDRPPLAADFPTIDWPVGLRARADWELDLKDTLPPGEYSLRTGLYEANSLNRWMVWDSEGAPLQDGIINLGSIILDS